MLGLDDYEEKEVLSPELFIEHSGISKFVKEVSHIKKYILTFKYMKEFISTAQNYNLREISWYNGLFVYTYEGEDIGLFISPIGAAAIATALEELIAFGGRYFVLVGGVGVLKDDIKRGDIIIPNEALRDEGTSHHYIHKNAQAKPSNLLENLLKAECKNKGLNFFEGATWTTDAPYRETPSRIKYAKEKGATCVDMEASACFAVAKFRHVELAGIFYGGDLVKAEGWNFREKDLNKSREVQEVLFEIVCNCLRRVS